MVTHPERLGLIMAHEKGQIIILISADNEWNVVRDYLRPVEVLCSPFGEWFQHDFDIQDRHVNVAFFQTGCGKIPAAAATQFVIDKYNPRIIINFGTCGGFKGKVEKEDILLVEKTVVYDIYERSANQDDQIAKYETELDLSWLAKPYPMNAVTITMATADQDLDPKRIPYLHQKYGAIAADWESGAIAYVAFRNKKVRSLIVRGVSDVLNPSNGKPSSEKEIREGTEAIMKKLIDGMAEWIAKGNLLS